MRKAAERLLRNVWLMRFVRRSAERKPNFIEGYFVNSFMPFMFIWNL